MKNQRGYLIIESLIAIVILVMVVLSLFSMISFLQIRTQRSKYESDAGIVLQDSMEIAHSALLSNWQGYRDGSYTPFFDAKKNVWVLVSGEGDEVQARFTRRVEINGVCRDIQSGERINSSVCPGKIDENSKTISVSILWREGESDKKIDVDLMVFNLPES